MQPVKTHSDQPYSSNSIRITVVRINVGSLFCV